MNIIISDVDRPLVIKVASISAARIQVYFIDNEDYFRRKAVYHDDRGKFFPDNGERAIFFARGVLETVKKLRWAPDIIHCSGWISHVLPLYLKKAYKEDPIFTNAKVVLSLFEDTPSETFAPGLDKAILFGGIKPKDIGLSSAPTGTELAKLAAQYSDGIILGSEEIDPELAAHVKGLGVPVLDFDKEMYSSDLYADKYNAFYDEILK
jgi:starch synthase